MKRELKLFLPTYVIPAPQREFVSLSANLEGFKIIFHLQLWPEDKGSHVPELMAVGDSRFELQAIAKPPKIVNR